MIKKTKEESLNLYYLKEDKKVKKVEKKRPNVSSKKKKTNVKNSNKIKEEKTKDETFKFDEEIIIGLKRIDEDEKKYPIKKQKNKQQNRPKSKINQKSNNIKNKQKEKPKESIEKKINPKQEIARKKKKILLRFVKWTSLLCIVIIGGIYTLLSPIFNVKTVRVTGNSKLTTQEIINLSKIELEQNMFKYKIENIINNIKEEAYINDVKVKRVVPDTIELIVTERKPTFMVPYANAYAIINNQGYILEITNKTEKMPIIIGTTTKQEEIHAGNRLCTEDLKKLGDVLKIMESATSNKVDELITQIDITKHNDYILNLKEKKKIVYLGDTSNLSTKMLWIIKFNELEEKNQGEIILNMNLNDEKNKPYFRKKI